MQSSVTQNINPVSPPNYFTSHDAKMNSKLNNNHNNNLYSKNYNNQSNYNQRD